MKIVVLDDDPTGSQTVHSCPLLLKWDIASLRKGLLHESPLLFILTNTRAMSPDSASKTIRQICKALIDVCQREGLEIENILLVSRGDSTLRGHGFLEPLVIAEELGPFDATFHVPAFFEGGRTTHNGIHFLNGIPVHKTIFAKDNLFGYSTSDLAVWLEEKSDGRILAQHVERLSIDVLENAMKSEDGMNQLINWLSNLSGNRSVVVDAQNPSHLEVFGHAIKELQGLRRFLFRSAASLINGLASIPENSHKIEDLVALRLFDSSGRYKPGLIMVGSHVSLANEQLSVLLQENNCVGVELPVFKIARVLDGGLPDILMSDLEKLWLNQINEILDSGRTPVLYTSRSELRFPTIKERILFGINLAELMSRLVVNITPNLGYIISKGGITTNTLLSIGFGFDLVYLKGQIMPGLSLVCCPDKKSSFNLPIITFPGNLGDMDTLLSAWKLMENVK